MPTVPFKQWLATALQSTTCTSPEYISAAIQIAAALSQQIVTAELHANDPNARWDLPPPFPTSCIDWSSCITVSLANGNGDGELNHSDLEPLSSREPFDRSIDDVLGMFAEDFAGENNLQRPLHDNHNEAAAGNNFGEISCMNIADANFIYSNGSQAEGPMEKLLRIYSLGLVFYQLFSGGKLPPPELLVVSSPNGGFMTIAKGTEANNELDVGESSDNNQYDTKSSQRGFVGALDSFANALQMPDEFDTARVFNGSEIDRARSSFNSFDGNSKRHLSDSFNSFDVSNGADPQSRNKRQSSYRSIRQSTSNTSFVRCEKPIDVLRMQGVPTAICDMVYNMIDCINGALMGQESYSEMFDVARDLQLMLQKPAIYLDPLDTDKLLLAGLELDDTSFVREHELSSLRHAYERSMAGSAELAIISGVSGSGKTTMANKLGAYVIANGGSFLSGKFDQMTIQSFSAIASAFDNFCSTLVFDGDTSSLIASKLRAALGSDLHFLVQMIPNLRLILNDEDASCDPIYNQDCVDAQQRLYYLLCQFVEVICTCSEGIIVLFIDDMQWADPASISIISHLLKTSRSMQDGKLFFLASCRDDEMTSDHPFRAMIESVSSFGFKTTEVKLGCMSKDTVNNVVSNLLHLSPRLVASLSDIVHHKTKGNPLFVSKMLRSLNREGLLRFSLTRHRWEWDEEKIQARKIPDDVASFFVDSISSLPVDVRLALCTLSCFGNSAHHEVLSAIETDLNLNLTESLNDAIAEGLLDKLGEKYYFCHDRIQEAAYSMIDEQDRCMHHMNYGLSLVTLALGSGHVPNLLTAVTQLNLGGPKAVQDKQQYSTIARYNLIAGKKAIEMSEFSSAFNYFDNGITFLRKKHWQDEYELSLELYNLAAKCALSIKEFSTMTTLCSSISMRSRTPEDALDSSFLIMTAMSHTNVLQSVNYGFSLLAQLGADLNIRKLPSRENIVKQIHQTQTMLNAISDETILNYHISTDHTKIMAMKLLAKMTNCLIQCKPFLAPLVTVKLVRLTIEHGLSSVSALGLAFFGGMIAALGDLRGGQRFTQLSRALLAKHQFSEFAGGITSVASDMLSYIEPLQLMKDHRFEAQRLGMAAGDIHCACMSKLLGMCDQMWSGTVLSDMKNIVTSAQQFSEEHGHLISLYYIKTFGVTVACLMCTEGEIINDEELTQSVIQNSNPFQLQILFFHKLFRSMVFSNYQDMKLHAEKFFEIRIHSWYLQAGYSVHVFIGGLVSFRIFRNTRVELWAERGREFKEKIQSWKEDGSVWNFEHKFFLLSAEEAYSHGQFENAKILYEKAVTTARQHKFLHEEAISLELAAYFHIQTGDKSTALEYFIQAHKRYYEWQAFAKVKALSAFIKEKFGDVFLAEDPTVGTAMDTIRNMSNPSPLEEDRDCFNRTASCSS